MTECREGDEGGDSHGHQASVEVRGRPGDTQTEEGPCEEQQDYGCRSDEAPLLGDDLEDEVVLRLRQVRHLETAAPEADAEQSA